MAGPLKILMLEDSQADAEIIQRLLRKQMAATDICLVMAEQDFYSALEDYKPDVILADNSMPQFDASTALIYTRKQSDFIPFIMVTGTVSEEFAANIIKLGADDYILKDRLARLPAAIEAAIKQRAALKDKETAKHQLELQEKKYRSLFEFSPLPILVCDITSYYFLDANKAAIKHYGYSKEEFLSLKITEIRPSEDIPRMEEELHRQKSEYRNIGTWQHITKDGRVIMVNLHTHDIMYNDAAARMVVVEDITERLEAEKIMKAMEREIAYQKIQEQKKISRAIIKAQEAERNHIGQELHDNINQILAGTKMYLSMAGNQHAELKPLVKYPIELIDSSINEIRILSSKHVTPLKNVNLRELVNGLLDKLETSSSINVVLQYTIPDTGLDDDLKLNLYRILQEVVNNVVKHAQASLLQVCFFHQNDAIGLTISDDGKGFDAKAKRNGIGISNMINRVESYNGVMSIKSSPGNGTITSVTIPLHRSPYEGWNDKQE